MATGPFAEEYQEALQANCVMQATGSFIYKDQYNILYQHDWVTLANGDIRMAMVVSDPRVYGESFRAVYDGRHYVTTGRVLRQTIVFSIDSDKVITIKSASDQVETIEKIKYRGPCVPKYEDKFCYHADNAVVDNVEFIVNEPYADYTFYDDFNGAIMPLSMHSPEVGGAWTTGGTGSVVLTGTGAADFTGDPLSTIFASNDFEIADATIVVDMSFAPDFDSGMQIEFNRTSDTDMWFLYHSAPSFVLFERTSNVSVARSTFTGTYGYTTTNVKIVTAGDTINVYQDNVLIITYTSPNRPNKTSTAFRLFWFRSDGNLQFNLVTARP